MFLRVTLPEKLAAGQLVQIDSFILKETLLPWLASGVENIS